MKHKQMNVIINSDKLDSLAMGVYRVTGEEPPLTLDEMTEALQNAAIGSGGITPTGNINITQAGQTDVTNYATATVPSGVLVSTLLASITPAISVNDNGLVTVSGEDYASESVVYQAGWMNTNSTLTVYKTAGAQQQLPTQAATTITPSTTAQTAVAKGKWTTGAVTVAAMPSGTTTAPTSISGTSATVSTGTNTLTLTKTVSVTPRVTTAGYVSAGTAGNSSVSLTASVTTKAAATYNVSSSNQTISASQYLTGAQTIRGVTTSGISAANIKAGVTVKVGDSADDDRITAVTGTFTSDANATAADIVSGKSGYVNGSKIDGSLVVQNYYTGSSAPASNLGNNGDLYFQTTGGQ